MLDPDVGAGMELLKKLLLASVCALAYVRLVQMVCDLNHSLVVAHGILSGQPEWQLYQSRLLAPVLIRLLGNDAGAYLLLIFLAAFAGGWLAYNLKEVAGLAIYYAASALLISPLVQPWDFLEPAIFMAFVWCVARRRSWRWFAPIFVIAICNRQSGEFIALWMALFGLFQCRRDFFWAGMMCGIAGVAMMWALQHHGGGVVQNGSAVVTDYFQYRLWDGLAAFDPRSGLLRNMAAQLRVTPLFLWTVFGTIIVAAARIVREHTELALTYLAMLAAIIPFGIVSETRVYWDFIPLLVLAGAAR
jgi:hypothetical protein